MKNNYIDKIGHRSDNPRSHRPLPDRPAPKHRGEPRPSLTQRALPTHREQSTARLLFEGAVVFVRMVVTVWTWVSKVDRWAQFVVDRRHMAPESLLPAVEVESLLFGLGVLVAAGCLLAPVVWRDGHLLAALVRASAQR